MDSIRIDIINQYVSLHGIKPNRLEIINYDDNLLIMIDKFTKWYKRAFEFAMGDQRDMNGFININNNYKSNIYTKYINEIENDNFLSHMLFIISDGNKGEKYIVGNDKEYVFPDL